MIDNGPVLALLFGLPGREKEDKERIKNNVIMWNDWLTRYVKLILKLSSNKLMEVEGHFWSWVERGRWSEKKFSNRVLNKNEEK